MTDIRAIARPASGSVQRATGGNYIGASATRDGALFTAAWVHALVAEGRVFYASDADANDRVTGQTSFADTTPTFSLEVPDGTVAIPLCIYLGQAGTVAGAAIDVNIAISPSALSRASGGTAETIYGARTDKPITPNSTLYSNPTATTALLVAQVRSWSLAQDVAPAEGAVQEILWTPEKQGHPIYLVGPSALGIFTYAGTTGPTWYWSIAWAEIPETALA